MRIRPIGDGDVDSVVELSLRAWAPVFASLERVLGSEIFGRLQPDWREDQRRAVREVCGAKKGRVWVAEAYGITVGFVAVGLFDAERSMGEVSMLAVDPDHQGGGIGTALTGFALDRLKDSGMAVAMVETGGEPRARRGAAHLREGRLHLAADSQVLQGALAGPSTSLPCRSWAGRAPSLRPCLACELPHSAPLYRRWRRGRAERRGAHGRETEDAPKTPKPGPFASPAPAPILT